ncbi:hypothetical protein OQA88_909 [Cercophora sp. LCS_1]
MATGFVSPSGATNAQDPAWPALDLTGRPSPRYNLVPGAEMPPSPDPKSFEANPTKTTPFIDHPLAWRPFYLRRTVLFVFAITFAAILVVIQILLAISNKNNGLGAGYRGQQYLWVYGPTAFLTIVSALWGRVEYQSKVAAPFIRLSAAGQPARPSQTLLLDYLSDWQPYSVVEALRNKDYVVSIASAVSLVLKVLIVLSTGLITLSLTTVIRDGYPLAVQDTFVNSPERLLQNSTLAFYITIGTIDANLTYPPGLSKDYAFQSFSIDGLPDRAEASAIVDGLSSTLDCEPAEVEFVKGEPWEGRRNPHIYINIKSPGCNVKEYHFRGPPSNACSYYQNNCTVAAAEFDDIRCDGIDGDEGRRMFGMFANVSWWNDWSRNRSDYTGSGVLPTYVTSIPHSTQVLCIPRYSIIPLHVTRNGSSQRVEPVLGRESRTLDSVSGWDIMGAYLDSLTNPIINQKLSSGSFLYNISGVAISAKNTMSYALETQLAPGVSPATLYDPEVFRNFLVAEYQRTAAAVAKSDLLGAAGESVTLLGTTTSEEERLVIRDWAAHAMSGLVAFCFVVTLAAAFLAPKHGILPRSPSTIPGLASMLAGSHQLTDRLRFSGDADAKTITRVLDQSAFQSGVVRDPSSGQARFIVRDTHSTAQNGKTWPQFRSLQAHPLIVHPATRIVVAVILCGLIVALEMLLRKSINEEGLGDVGDDTYIHYTWTTIPAVVFGLLSLTISAMDFRTRSIAPYSALKRTVDGRKLMTLDFLDALIPRAIYREIRLANFSALAVTLAFLIASFFTTLSASLFGTHSLPVIGSVLLPVNQSFVVSPNAILDDLALPAASIILESNASYPRFTYENMAFLELLPPALSPLPDARLDPFNLAINAIVPAIRGKMECREYDSSQIRLNHSIGYYEAGVYDPLGVWIDDENCDRDEGGDYGPTSHEAYISTYPNMTYFGVNRESSFYSNDFKITDGCSDMLYVWGKMDNDASPKVQYVSALACNVTFEALDVNVTFLNPALDIDSSRPPIPLNNTVRPSNVERFNPLSSQHSQTHIYHNLVEMPSGLNNFASFFQVLTTSRWAIPPSHLGDPERHREVIDAIKFQHGIIQAQVLNTNRMPANVSNSTLPQGFEEGDNEANRVINATVISPEARRRIVQDIASTRVLQVLLGVTLALLIVNWVLGGGARVMSGSPTSLATRAAVVSGGDMLALFPKGSEWMSDKELEGLWEGRRYKLGWERGGFVDEGAGDRFGIFVEGGQGAEMNRGDEGSRETLDVEGRGVGREARYHDDEM